MKMVRKNITTLIFTIGLLTGVFCGGCAELRWHPVYTSALVGAAVGAIIGHQSEEEGEGALIGAAIAATGELLQQSDMLAGKEKAKKCDKEKQNKESEKEEIIVKVTNSNSSITKVVLKKKGNIYIGPKGEEYQELPNEEQLKPLYGL
jgi:gas vesicle protein